MKSCKFEGSIFFELYKFFNYLPDPGSASTALVLFRSVMNTEMFYFGEMVAILFTF